MRNNISILILACLLLSVTNASAQNGKLSTVIQKGHSEVVKAAQYSPDGQFIITGSRDKSAKLWDVASGHELRTFLGHQHTVNQVTFIKDGKYLATSSADNSAKIWEVLTGKELFSVKGDNYMTDVVFSPDGKLLITAGYENVVVIWDWQNNLAIDSLKAASEKGLGYGLDLAYSADGKWLAVGQDNQRVKVYETVNWSEVYDFPIESGYCGGCIGLPAFSPDSKKLAKLGNGGPLYQYDLNSGEQLSKWGDDWDDASSIAYSPDGKNLLVALEKEVFILKAANGDTTLQFTPEVNQINDAVYSPDGEVILISGNDNMTTLFSAEDGTRIDRLEGILNNQDKGGLSYNPNSYWDSFIARYVKLKNMQLVTRGGTRLIRSKFGDKARIWEINNGRAVMEFSGHEKTILGLDLSRDEKRLLTAAGDRKIKLWNTETGDELQTFSGHSNIVFEAKFNSDESQMISTGWDARVNLWDVKSNEILTRIDFGNASAYAVEFTPNDLYFVAARLDKTLEMWEFDTRSVVRKFIGHTDVVSKITFLKGGQQMATASWDGSVRIWDIASGLMTHKLKTEQPVYEVISTGDEKYLISGGADRMIRFWNRETGQVDRVLEGHKAPVVTLNLIREEKLLVSSDLDGTTKFWDLNTNSELFEHIHIGKNDWMVKTNEGFFSATDGARKAIHFVEGLKSYSIDQFFNEFYRPDLIEELLSGNTRKVKGLNDRLLSSPPPEIKLAAIKADDEQTARVFIRATDMGGGVEDLKLFHNGKRINIADGQWNSVKKRDDITTYEYQLSLVGGVNVIAASASSAGNIESKVAESTLNAEIKVPDATCHIFVVGIDQYQNQKLNLNYATEDAKAISDAFTQSAGTLFKEVKVHSLFDQEATKESILAKLDELSREVRLHDVFVFYYAGHGSVVENNFYFIPHENARLYDEKGLEKSALRADLIQKKLESIQALKQIIVMDACQSGGTVELLAQRGALEEKAIAQLSRSAGIHVLAAAGSDQFATEFQALGHGLFTYVLLQALNGKADGAPKDGKVTIYELKSYLDDQVPEHSQQHKGTPQYPYTFSRGNDFPVVLSEN